MAIVLCNSWRFCCTSAIIGENSSGWLTGPRGSVSSAGHEILLQISVQQRAHAFGQDQRREKILIQALAADQEETFLPDAHRANREQAQIDGVRRVHAAQESALGVPVRLRS